MHNTMPRFSRLLAGAAGLLLAVLLLSGCDRSSAPPIIRSFEAVPARVSPGGTTELRWETFGSAPIMLSIDNNVGNVSNLSSRRIVVNRTTTFTLTARNGGGNVQRQVTVTVQ